MFLVTLDSDSATGPDGISSCVLKTRSAAFACPLSLPFSSCHLPLVIFHLFRNQPTSQHCIKRCKKSDSCNDGPISLLPIISKVMESIIAVDIKSFLFSHSLISDHQFGFRPDHSTLDMLLLLSQQWMEALNIRNEIRAVSLDISRVFFSCD